MRAVLTNYGSTGSVYPYVALAIELRRHGHHPVLALPPGFAGLAARHGLEFAAIGPEQREVQTRINEAMVDLPEAAEAVAELLRPLAASLPEMYADLCRACAGADVLIGGPVQPAALMVHETQGLPYVSIQNVHFASGGSEPFVAGLSLVVNQARVGLGLRPLHDPIMQSNDAAALVLFAMSRHVRRRHASWPNHFHLTGYFFVEEAFVPDASLDAFLRSGPPPVVVSFGSMTHDNAADLTHLVVEAVTRAGARAVIQHGWSGLAMDRLPEHVRAVGFVPHDWLFPRASLVLHHGGSGTTASVLRAGVPAVVVPHTWDQPVWARLAEDLGCAAPMIPLRELTVTRLESAITGTLTTAYQRAAAELGRKIRGEQGVQTARRLVEQLTAQLGL